MAVNLSRWKSRWQTLEQQARQVFHAGRDFLFPPACLSCGAVPEPLHAALCAECAEDLSPSGRPACQRCAATVGPLLDTSAGCVYCREERFAFRRVIALGEYAGRLQQLVRRGKLAAGAPAMLALTDLFLDRHHADLLTETFDAIVPVPHYWMRRGWQIHAASETIAERLARRLRRPYTPHILLKRKPTPLQAQSSVSDRLRQQRGAFEVEPGLRLESARLVLVDDVMTTGATVQAAARALIDAGAADVLVVVLARGVGKRGRSNV